MNQAPNNGQWQRLTAAASEFYKIAPWQWMEDTVFFGIQAPGTEEVNYGCIMGKGASIWPWPCTGERRGCTATSPCGTAFWEWTLFQPTIFRTV